MRRNREIVDAMRLLTNYQDTSLYYSAPSDCGVKLKPLKRAGASGRAPPAGLCPHLVIL